MTTEKRTSEQGNVFSGALIREFLLAALSHDAVTDAVDAMLFEHVAEGRIHSSVITENLRPLITEVLEVATLEDWRYVSCKLIEDACEALRKFPTGELPRSTAQLEHPYAQDPLPPSKYRRAWLLIRKISSLTGISRETILADARADTEAVRADDAVRTSRSSGHSPIITIALDNGQFNRLISGLGLARLALNGCGDEYVGFAWEYSQLADEIVAQIPGDGPAPRAARERLAIQEGRATSIRKPS